MCVPGRDDADAVASEGVRGRVPRRDPEALRRSGSGTCGRQEDRLGAADRRCRTRLGRRRRPQVERVTIEAHACPGVCAEVDDRPRRRNGHRNAAISHRALGRRRGGGGAHHRAHEGRDGRGVTESGRDSQSVESFRAGDRAGRVRRPMAHPPDPSVLRDHAYRGPYRGHPPTSGADAAVADEFSSLPGLSADGRRFSNPEGAAIGVPAVVMPRRDFATHVANRPRGRCGLVRGHQATRMRVDTRGARCVEPQGRDTARARAPPPHVSSHDTAVSAAGPVDSRPGRPHAGRQPPPTSDRVRSTGAVRQRFASRTASARPRRPHRTNPLCDRRRRSPPRARALRTPWIWHACASSRESPMSTYLRPRRRHRAGCPPCRVAARPHRRARRCHHCRSGSGDRHCDGRRRRSDHVQPTPVCARVDQRAERLDKDRPIRRERRRGGRDPRSGTRRLRGAGAPDLRRGHERELR